jgi:flagellar assembly protein FliH
MDEIDIKLYKLREVVKEQPPPRSDPAAFVAFEDQEEQGPERGEASGALSPEELEAQKRERERELERQRELDREMERERIAQVERAAYEKAFKLGEEAGSERGERMFQSAVQSFVKAAEEIRSAQEEFFEQVEGQILDLVLATTQKVVHREINDRRDVVIGILREAISRAVDRERIRVRINPSDFELVQTQKPDILRSIEGIKQLVVEKDENVSRGGAVVETDHGTIDARIERRFAEVEKALKRQKAARDKASDRDYEEGRGEQPPT